jgi:GAF domain-containing protein
MSAAHVTVTLAARAEFDARVDHLLQKTCEVARSLVGAHQAAMAMVVDGDWSGARKYFSLSDKYARYERFTAPVRGVGLHALVVAKNEPLRLTQAEVEAHPGWRGFSETARKHPPLRGLLAVPIVGEDGLNYGLLQASDKGDGGEFDADDERRLEQLADAAAVGLDALRKVLAMRLGQDAPAAAVPTSERFVVIEPA